MASDSVAQLVTIDELIDTDDVSKIIQELIKLKENEMILFDLVFPVERINHYRNPNYYELTIERYMNNETMGNNSSNPTEPTTTSSSQTQPNPTSSNQTQATVTSSTNWKLTDLHLHHLKLLVFGAYAQDTLQKLLSYFTVNNNLVTQHHHDPSLAIVQIFQQHLPQLQSISNLFTNPTNRNLIYHDVPTQTLKNKIDIKKMDTTLLVDILNKLNAFPTASQNNNTLICMYNATGNHQDKCCVACAHICFHCLRGKCRNTCCLTNKKCEHACCCGLKYWQCNSYKSVCCNTCNLCFYCLMTTNSVDTWMKLIQKLAAKSITICEISDVRIAIEIIVVYRNFVMHLTNEQCNQMDYGDFHNERLPGLTEWSLIHPIISYAIKTILEYLYAKQFLSKFEFDVKLLDLKELLKFKTVSDLLGKKEDLVVSYTRLEQMTELISSFQNLTTAVWSVHDTVQRSNLESLKLFLRFEFPGPVKFNIYDDFAKCVKRIFKTAVKQCLHVEERSDTYKAVFNGSPIDTVNYESNNASVVLKFSIKPKSPSFSLDEYEENTSEESLMLWKQIEKLVEQNINDSRLPPLTVTCIFWELGSIIIHAAMHKSNGESWADHEIDEFIRPKLPYLSEEIEQAFEGFSCLCTILERVILPDNVVDLEYTIFSSQQKIKQVDGDLFKNTFRKLFEKEKTRGDVKFIDIALQSVSNFKARPRRDEAKKRSFKNEVATDIDISLQIPFEQLNIGKLIGRGAFSKIRVAKWKDKPVVLKSFDRRFGEVVQKEVDFLSKLHHPNIIDVYGYTENSENTFMVIEYADCGSLNDVIHNQNIQYTPNDVLNWALQLAEGINYLHTRKPKIIHSDLKPANILVLADRQVLKISGLGEAREIFTNSFTGTALWMAPEVIRGDVYNEKRNVYSFAVILWGMIFRKTPFYDLLKRESTSAITYMIAAKGFRPKPLAEIPVALKDFITKCWNEDSTIRPSFDEVIKFLKPAYKYVHEGDDELFTIIDESQRDEWYLWSQKSLTEKRTDSISYQVL